jgi:hypothetical protein
MLHMEPSGVFQVISLVHDVVSVHAHSL